MPEEAANVNREDPRPIELRSGWFVQDTTSNARRVNRLGACASGCRLTAAGLTIRIAKVIEDPVRSSKRDHPVTPYAVTEEAGVAS